MVVSSSLYSHIARGLCLLNVSAAIVRLFFKLCMHASSEHSSYRREGIQSA